MLRPCRGAARTSARRRKTSASTALKAEGKPSFPYAVAKDVFMACVVMA